MKADNKARPLDEISCDMNELDLSQEEVEEVKPNRRKKRTLNLSEEDD